MLHTIQRNVCLACSTWQQVTTLTVNCQDASAASNAFRGNAHSVWEAEGAPLPVPIYMRTCTGIGECRPERSALWLVCNMVDWHDGSEDRCRLIRRGGLRLLRRDHARAAAVSAHSIDERLLATKLLLVQCPVRGAFIASLTLYISVRNIEEHRPSRAAEGHEKSRSASACAPAFPSLRTWRRVQQRAPFV